MKNLRRLISSALRELWNNKEDHQTPDRLYHVEIEELSQLFSPILGWTTGKLVNWIKQFKVEDWPLCIKMLQNIKFYTVENITAYTDSLLKLVNMEYKSIAKNRIFYVPIGTTGGGSHYVARALKANSDIPNTQIIERLELARLKPDDVDVLVFYDDFSGTGDTIDDWITINDTLFRPLCDKLVLGILILNPQAETVLGNLDDFHLLSSSLLTLNDNVLSTESNLFNSTEKAGLLKYCKNTGCDDLYIRGFGDCGLLINFPYGCPDNSLPILWHNQKGHWKNLFNRRVLA